MDLLKIFPSLILDLISKVVPGFFFLVVFQNRYLPLREFLLKFIEPQTLSPEWLTGANLICVLVVSYLIGVIIAILGNEGEKLLVTYHWFPRIKRQPDKFVFADDRPKAFGEALSSASTFIQFLDHCRDFISVNSAASAAMLEKYRTAYRLFFGVTLLLLTLPFAQPRPQSLLAFAAPVLALLCFHMSRRYVCKSIQLYALAKASDPDD